MNVKSMLIGVLLGMATGIILTETCPCVKRAVSAGKKKLKRLMNTDEW